jgi:hypothetical protein
MPGDGYEIGWQDILKDLRSVAARQMSSIRKSRHEVNRKYGGGIMTEFGYRLLMETLEKDRKEIQHALKKCEADLKSLCRAINHSKVQRILQLDRA